MLSAQLLTIGTEITSGEVVNSNASWISLRLEEMGVRVRTHLTVRDHKKDILSALNFLNEGEVIIVTGGLGPTSDDLTRECMALYWQDKLEFDQAVWEDLEKLYRQRELPLREAHRGQCQFPAMSERLKNPVGTALGFSMEFRGRKYFVLPGPPKELESMWNLEVEPRMRKWLKPTPMKWVRWTCLGVPESEVAEVVEPVLAGTGLEVGYRAQIPYVKIKVYADPKKHASVIANMENALAKWIVARDQNDLANELLDLWPNESLLVHDEVTDARFLQRLVDQKNGKVRITFTGSLSNSLAPQVARINERSSADHNSARTENAVQLSFEGERLKVSVTTTQKQFSETIALPFKLQITSERGKRSAAEWAIWTIVKNLRS